MRRLTDVFLLNLVYLLFCLPIVTIGAATVAAYTVTIKMVDDEEGYIFRDFLKAFKANFPRGTLLWLLNAVAGYALYLDWQLAIKPDNPSVLVIVIGILSAAFIFAAFIYAYPLTARYDNTLRNTLENSVQICLKYFGRTLILLAVLALEIVLFVWNLPMMVIGVLVGPMILIYTVSGVSKRMFEKIDRDR